MAPPAPPPARVVRCDAADLTAADHARIHGFVTEFMLYERVPLDETLDAASYVWLCLDPKGRLVGTTAVRRIDLPAGTGGHQRPVSVVYTSVVAVKPEYRRAGLPARMGLKTYLHERTRAPLTPLYWLAEAASPSGYLQMARNFEVFWPRPGIVMPAGADDILTKTLKTAGLTKVERGTGFYRVLDDFGVIEREQAPDKWDRSDPAVDYFLKSNPDYWTGISLVCLAPLNIGSVTRAVGGVFLRMWRRRGKRR